MESTGPFLFLFLLSLLHLNKCFSILLFLWTHARFCSSSSISCPGLMLCPELNSNSSTDFPMEKLCQLIRAINWSTQQRNHIDHSSLNQFVVTDENFHKDSFSHLSFSPLFDILFPASHAHRHQNHVQEWSPLTFLYISIYQRCCRLFVSHVHHLHLLVHMTFTNSFARILTKLQIPNYNSNNRN